MSHNLEGGKTNVRQEDLELLLVAATIFDVINNFSTDNKLWDEGFGPVYKVRICPFQQMRTLHACNLDNNPRLSNLYGIDYSTES